MTLGRENFSVMRTDCSADVFRLAGFLRDNDLIGHNGLVWKDRFDNGEMRTYSERYRLASCVRHFQPANLGGTPACDVTCLRAPTQPDREAEHNLAKVGVEGSNPFARSKNIMNYR